jgi:hypothetical protein
MMSSLSDALRVPCDIPHTSEQHTFKMIGHSTFPLLRSLQQSRFHSHRLAHSFRYGTSCHNFNLPAAHSGVNCIHSSSSKYNARTNKKQTI